PSTSLKFDITWLRMRAILGHDSSPSNGLPVTGRRKFGLERIALDWNRGAIQERVNPLGQTKESVFSQPEHALASNSRPTPRLLVAHQSLTILGQGKFGLEQYHPDWNRQMPVRVMKLLEKTDIERVQPA
ncbi:MAG: hypothetical protein ACREFS_02455, partial [Acetobacteraceae bacterium]